MSARFGEGHVIGCRYEIVRLLARGGMAEIYLARDRRCAREVALKTLATSETPAPDLCRRLIREGEITRSIIHPNVVKVLDGGIEEGVPFLVLELLQGETLGHYFAREGRMPRERAVRVIWQAAQGLSAAHHAGVVHRDVKPDNLFLCGPIGAPWTVKVLDFGLAKVPSGMGRSASPTVKGTLEYMPPEQVLAEPVDARSDVYALGVVLFRALTGELPFDGLTLELLHHQLRSPAPPPSWLLEQGDVGMDRVVQAALRKHPGNRYPAMDDFAEDLRRLIGRQPVYGAPLVHEPDRYEAWTEAGLQALNLFERHRALASRPSEPVATAAA